MNLQSLRGRQVTIVEVGPRDGLQNEKALVSTADKVQFVNLLSEAHLPVIEVSAFVSPKWVPQMADAGEVFAGIERRPGTRYTALVPNSAGLDRALTAGVDEIAIFTAASETFNRMNINQTIAGSLDLYRPVAARALSTGMRVRGYLSTAFGCPYEGAVPPETVVAVTQQLLDIGVYEVSVGDTIGVAHPAQVEQLLALLLRVTDPGHLALHFHDTRGTALANVMAALPLGIATFDSSTGGLGGCPYAPGASGNLATDDLLYLLDGLGIETGVSLKAVSDASAFIGKRLDHRLPSRYAQATAASTTRT